MDWCENLWDLAGIVRMNSLKNCKLQLMANLQYMFAGVKLHMTGENSV